MTAEVMDLRAWRGSVDENNGKPLKTMKNLMVYLANVCALGDQIRHNELTGNIEWDGEPITDTDLIDIRVILESEDPPCEFATQDLYPAIQRHAKENTYHPIRDYLGSLKWDKKPRLDRWLISALGAENTAFNQAIARRSLISAVARAYEPGCKVDTVLVLEGPQGVRKSTAVATLFGPEYTAESVSLFDQHNKMVMAMKGHWVVELAEFVAFFKKDKSAVKGMISMRSDNVVLPYAKMASNHPRQCIFIGTINPGNFGYLTDDENRRYWPVTVGKCDTDLLLEHRDQIWAEAVTAYRNNEQWWLTDEEEVLAKEQVAARATVHPWDALVEEELAHVDHITVVEALKRIGVMKDRMDLKEQFQIGESLRKNGFIKEDKRRMRDGVRAFWWVRKDG